MSLIEYLETTIGPPVPFDRIAGTQNFQQSRYGNAFLNVSAPTLPAPGQTVTVVTPSTTAAMLKSHFPPPSPHRSSPLGV